jgi:FKBP-type peptidyl-prolyl cis-trans isomerase
MLYKDNFVKKTEVHKCIVEKTDKDFEDCADRYKECKAKGDQLLKDSNPANLQETINNDKKRIFNIREENRLRIVSYEKIITEIQKELNKTTNLKVQEQLKKQLEETQAQKNELIEANKNQLKQKSPNFNARDNHARDMKFTRYGFKTIKR